MTDADRPDLDAIERIARGVADPEGIYGRIIDPPSVLWLVAAARERDRLAAELAAARLALRQAIREIDKLAEQQAMPDDSYLETRNRLAALARLLPGTPEGTP